MSGLRETKRVLVVVRTYPTPAKTGVEVSCTAGITDTGEWIRLFPIPYRFLDADKRFTKYHWITVNATRAKNDPRPESYRIDQDSIRIVSVVGPERGWKARRAIIDPLVSHCLCCLKRAWDANKFPTLGLFRPKTIARLMIQADSPTWTTEQLQMLRQGSLAFQNAPETELEKVPYVFKYEFRCDHDDCKGHKLSCTDWEMGAAWRRWRHEYGANRWEEKFRETWERKMLDKYDTHFFVGTVNNHPREWIIVGLFYPPRQVLKANYDLFS